MRARLPAMLTVAFFLFGILAICHGLDFISAVSIGAEWRRPLAAMLLSLVLATGVHFLAHVRL